jgi:hypothetical protein
VANIWAEFQTQRGNKKMSMKTKLTVNVETFTVPNALKVSVSAEILTMPLTEIDPEVLSELCNFFRKEVFQKAGKRDPLEDGPETTPVIDNRDNRKGPRY